MIRNTFDLNYLFNKDKLIGNNKYITIEDIDLFFNSNPGSYIRVGSIRQNEFDYLIEKSKDRFEGMQFVDLMVENLSIFSNLKNINKLLINWNRKATKLWDMKCNLNLENLYLGSITKLRKIDEIKTAPKLKWLSIDNGIWPSMELNTLSPLAHTNIEFLQYRPKKLHDLDFSFLIKMPKLKEIQFSLNYHTTEEIAWMKAKMPNIEGWGIAPYVKFERKAENEDDVCICGKRKPFLNSIKDEERIKKYTKKFWELVEYYKTNDIIWRNE